MSHRYQGSRVLFPSPLQHRGPHAVPVTDVTEGGIAVRPFGPDLGAALGLCCTAGLGDAF